MKKITNPLIRKNGHTDSINSLSGILMCEVCEFAHFSYKGPRFTRSRTHTVSKH